VARADLSCIVENMRSVTEVINEQKRSAELATKKHALYERLFSQQQHDVDASKANSPVSIKNLFFEPHRRLVVDGVLLMRRDGGGSVDKINYDVVHFACMTDVLVISRCTGTKENPAEDIVELFSPRFATTKPFPNSVGESTSAATADVASSRREESANRNEDPSRASLASELGKYSRNGPLPDGKIKLLYWIEAVSIRGVQLLHNDEVAGIQNSFMLDFSAQTFMFCAPTAAERDAWLDDLRRLQQQFSRLPQQQQQQTPVLSRSLTNSPKLPNFAPPSPTSALIGNTRKRRSSLSVTVTCAPQPVVARKESVVIGEETSEATRTPLPNEQTSIVANNMKLMRKKLESMSEKPVFPAYPFPKSAVPVPDSPII